MNPLDAARAGFQTVDADAALKDKALNFLGQWLVSCGLITEGQLRIALGEQQRTQRSRQQGAEVQHPQAVKRLANHAGILSGSLFLSCA